MRWRTFSSIYRQSYQTYLFYIGGKIRTKMFPKFAGKFRISLIWNTTTNTGRSRRPAMEHSTCMQPTMTLGSSHVWEMIFFLDDFLKSIFSRTLKKNLSNSFIPNYIYMWTKTRPGASANSIRILGMIDRIEPMVNLKFIFYFFFLIFIFLNNLLMICRWKRIAKSGSRMRVDHY